MGMCFQNIGDFFEAPIKRSVVCWVYFGVRVAGLELGV